MTRREAFEKVINQRNVHHQIGMSSSAVRALRYALNHDRVVSEDKMRSVLEKYGATLKQEEVWKLD